MQPRGGAVCFALVMGSWLAVSLAAVQSPPQPQTTPRSPIANPRSPTPDPQSPIPAVVDTYCVSCHNQRLNTAGLALDAVDAARPAAHPDVWERVVTRLRGAGSPWLHWILMETVPPLGALYARVSRNLGNRKNPGRMAVARARKEIGPSASLRCRNPLRAAANRGKQENARVGS